MAGKYEPRKRTALDGKVWWYPFDVINHKWSTLLCHGKHKTKWECEYYINLYHEKGWY